MSDELVPLFASMLLPSPATDRLRITPVVIYLARIRPVSRRVVELRLRQCAKIVGWTGELLVFPFELLGVEHVAALTGAVRERFAPSTGRAILVALRGVLRACWQAGCYGWEEYERRADAFVRIEGERVRRGRALTPKEVAALYRAAGPRDRAMLALLFGAGLRRNEVSTLTWDRFDGAALRVLGKGDRERVVPLPPWSSKSLNTWRAGESKPGLIVGLTAEGVRSALHALATRTGIADVTCHDARRTFISELLDVADASTVAEISGHQSLDQLKAYDRRGERACVAAVGRLRSMVDVRDGET